MLTIFNFRKAEKLAEVVRNFFNFIERVRVASTSKIVRHSH